MVDNDDSSAFAATLVPRQKRSREARERILAAAEAVLRKDGVDGFSMAAVGNAAHLPVGNIYRRFEGKDAVLLALKEIVAARIRDAVAKSVQDGGHDDLESFVRSFTAAIGTVFSRDEELHKALFDPRISSPQMLATGKFTKSTNFAFFRDGLKQYMAALPHERFTVVTRVSFSLIMNAALQKVRGFDPILAELDWPDVVSEFGGVAERYLRSELQSSQL